MRKVLKVEPLDDYMLELTFDNNEVKIKDMKPHFRKGIFSTLKNKSLFNTVKVSFGAISWDNDIDLCADFLYETSYEKKE